MQLADLELVLAMLLADHALGAECSDQPVLVRLLTKVVPEPKGIIDQRSGASLHECSSIEGHKTLGYVSSMRIVYYALVMEPPEGNERRTCCGELPGWVQQQLQHNR